MSEEMNHYGLTPYEQFKVGSMQSRRPSGVGIAGLGVGIGAAVIGVAGWLYANSQAKKAQEVAAAKNDGLRDLIGSLANTVAAERNERINGDITLSNTVNDSVSGSQQGTLTAMQQAELNATQQLMLGLQTGKYSENPQKVALYRDATPCGCPATGCGCGA
jgi:gas vesicle protein